MKEELLTAIGETMVETRSDYEYEASDNDSLSYIDVSRGSNQDPTPFGSEVASRLLEEHSVIIVKVRDFRDAHNGMDWRLWFRPIQSEEREVTRTETVYTLSEGE